jgi:phage-related protein
MSSSSSPVRAPKAIAWRGTSHRDLAAFPEEAKRLAGYQLWRLQQGEEADDWKPMSTVGAGTIEIRVCVGRAFRVFVITKFEEAIYVLHAFEKKSQKTSKADIELAAKRYRELIAERHNR